MTKSAYAFLAKHEKMCWDFNFAECRDKGCGFKHHDGGKEAGLRELTTVIGESGVAKFKRMWHAREAERKAARQAMREAAVPSANNHEAKATLPKGASTKAPKQYKLMAKGSLHMLHALRTCKVSGGRSSTQVRRILRAQGWLPEVRSSQGPQGFSQWDDANGEWIEDSEDKGADGAHETPRQDSNNADDMPGLVEMPELGYDESPIYIGPQNFAEV